MKYSVGITMGDPKGIGPEIVAKAWARLTDDEKSHILIYGDLAVLNQAAELAKIEFNHKNLIITSSTHPPIAGMEDSEAARLSISAIDAAITDAAASRINGVITAPVNKHRMQLVKPGFFGHTEYFSKAAHVRDTVMMFASEDSFSTANEENRAKRTCFSLVTMHLALKDVATHITSERVLATIRQTHTALEEYFSRPDARIAVMSLNPHSGENGSLGNEEKTAITPAINKAVKEGIQCVGPVAADTLFRNMGDFDYDAVVAMYHDQGLLPVKLLCPHNCVNITLGLPYVRTSPGHGTAEDIAWIGQADELNMLAAIKLAMRLIMGK